MISKIDSADHFIAAFEKSGFSDNVEIKRFESLIRNKQSNSTKNSIHCKIIKKSTANKFFDFYNSCFQETQLEKKVSIEYNKYCSSKYPVNETFQVANRVLEMILIDIANNKKYRFLLDKIKGASIIIKTNKDTTNIDILCETVFFYKYLILLVIDHTYIQEIKRKILINTLYKILKDIRNKVTKKDFPYMPFYKNQYPINIEFDVSANKDKYGGEKISENKGIV